MKHPTRSILCLILMAVVLLITACAQTPEKVRLWQKDSRAPVKMREFILDQRNSLETKIESVLILIERNEGNRLPQTLDEPVTAVELNKIVEGVIPRMRALVEQNEGYETRVKDAAYYMLTELDLSDENHDALIEIIHHWLDGENFFLSMEKAGRIEHAKLFNVIGQERALSIYKNALESKLDALDVALDKENKLLEERRAKGENPKIRYRPSDNIAKTIETTLSSLNELKIISSTNKELNSPDVVAEMFVKRMEKLYPNMPKVYALPFASNESDILRPMAKKILSDQEYKNPTLNYFKDVMLATYYKKVQKEDGIEVCTQLIQTDRTGYTRWDCMELVTAARGREGLGPLLQSLPDDYSIIGIPEDHPVFIESPSLTFWNSTRAYCSHLPKLLNNQVPLEVFRQLIANGSKVDKVLSISCLATLGVESDLEILNKMRTDKTNMAEYGMKVTTLGDLANYAMKVILEKRIAAMQPKAEEAKTEEAKTEEAKK